MIQLAETDFDSLLDVKYNTVPTAANTPVVNHAWAEA